MIARHEGGLVFLDVSVSSNTEAGMPSSGDDLRSNREVAAAHWLMENADEELTDIPVRFDEIAVLILNESRALLRHHVNSLGATEA